MERNSGQRNSGLRTSLSILTGDGLEITSLDAFGLLFASRARTSPGVV
jgi:hypothetical protein